MPLLNWHNPFFHERMFVLNLSSETWAAIIGGFTASVVAGGISYYLQLLEHNRAHKRQITLDKDREENENIEIAQEIFFKIVRMYSNYKNINKHVQKSADDAVKKGIHLWHEMPSIPNLPEKVHLTARELRFILKANSIVKWNKVGDISLIHNGVLDEVTNYNELRNDIRRSLLNITEVDNFEFYANHYLNKNLAPTVELIDSLSNSMKERLPKYVEDSEKLLKDYNDFIKNDLNINSFELTV